MYQSYKTKQEIPKEPSFEERLIPKEVVNSPSKIANANNSEIKSLNPLSGIFGNLFNTIELDDIIILGILILLFYENCEDNILIIILVALLFIR